MHFIILSFILFSFPPLPFALVEVDLTRSLKLEGIVGIRQFEAELGKNCTPDSQWRTIARLVSSNNYIDDIQSIRIKIRWIEALGETKPVLQFQVVQTRVGDEVKIGKQSVEFNLIGCLLLTVTAAEQNNSPKQRKEIASTNRIAQQSNNWGVQLDLSHLRDIDVIIRLPTKIANMLGDGEAKEEVSNSDEIQSNELENIRFSMTEATICALMLDFHFFGKANSAQFEVFSREEYFKAKEKQSEKHCEFEWLIDFCIRYANRGIIGAQRSVGYAAQLRDATRSKLTESSTTLMQISELISAQKAVPYFSQSKLHCAIKDFTGFSVICDLLLGVLSAAQTIQFTSTVMEIDVPAYLNVLKRAHYARALKMKWIQKGLTKYGSQSAVFGIFETSIEEFRAPLRMISIYGPVGWSLGIDDGEGNGWMKIPENEWKLNRKEAMELFLLILRFAMNNGSSYFTGFISFCRLQKELEMPIEKLDFCSKIEGIVDEPFFTVLMRVNFRVLCAYKDILSFPQSTPELHIPSDSEDVQLRNILMLMLGINLLDIFVTNRRKTINSPSKNGDFSYANEREIDHHSDDDLLNAYELIRDKVLAIFEHRQKYFKEYNFAKLVQKTTKTLRPRGFNLVMFKNIVIEFGDDGKEQDELSELFVSVVNSLLNEIKEKEIASLKEVKHKKAQKLEEEKLPEKFDVQAMNINEASENTNELQKDLDKTNIKTNDETKDNSRDFAMNNERNEDEIHKADIDEENIERLLKGKYKMESEYPNPAVVEENENGIEDEKENATSETKEIDSGRHIRINEEKKDPKRNSKNNKPLKKCKERAKEKKQFKQTDFQQHIKESECALTITETFLCITALDDYLKMCKKSVKKRLDGRQKTKTDMVMELFDGAKLALTKAIHMAGSPIQHQKTVLEMLVGILFSSTKVQLTQITDVIIKPGTYMKIQFTMSMLHALGQSLVISIWKLTPLIELHLRTHTAGKREYGPGALLLGTHKTLNYFKRFDNGAREHLLATLTENDDEHEETVKLLSKMLQAYTQLMQALVVVSPATEKYENIKYWYTNWAISGRKLVWTPEEVFQLVYDLVLNSSETKVPLLAAFLTSISEDKRNERKLVQRFCHKTETLGDKMYVTVGFHANLFLMRLCHYLYQRNINGSKEQQFCDLRQRTYLSDSAEQRVIRVIAKVSILDFFALVHNQQQDMILFEKVRKEMEKHEDEIWNKDVATQRCPKCAQYEEHYIRNSRNQIESKMILRISHQILSDITILSAEKHFDRQWNLLDQFDAMGFKSGKLIRQLLQNHKRHESDRNTSNDQPAKSEFQMPDLPVYGLRNTSENVHDSLHLTFELANECILALANFLIEPSSPLAISSKQNAKLASGWGLLLDHSPKSQFLTGNKKVDEKLQTNKAEDISSEREFLYAARKLISLKLYKHSLLNEESKKEGNKNLLKFFTNIWVTEKAVEQKMNSRNDRIMEKFRRHFERTILIVFARAILHEFIFVYIFHDQNGDLITSKIAENLPPDMRKTIWFTYYIDLMKEFERNIAEEAEALLKMQNSTNELSFLLCSLRTFDMDINVLVSISPSAPIGSLQGLLNTVQVAVKKPTANELDALVQRLRMLLVMEQKNQLSCRQNMFPMQWPDSYAVHEERNKRNIEQPESVVNDFNEKFIHLIIHTAEFIISELNLLCLHFTMKSAQEMATNEEKSAELFKQGTFLTTEEETAIHLYTYVRLIVSITSQCIIELENEMENAAPEALELENRKAIALEKWRALENLLGAKKGRLFDQMCAIFTEKLNTNSDSTESSRMKISWESEEIKLVDLGVCEMIGF